jgi:hypothetical protein
MMAAGQRLKATEKLTLLDRKTVKIIMQELSVFNLESTN